MEKLESAKNALARLEAILSDPDGDEKTRDASIQRFEFTSEICWKALQEVLKQVYDVEVRYPKGCYQAAFQVSLIDEDLCLALTRSIKDRNLTSHTYNQELSEMIYRHIPIHAKAFALLLNQLQTVIDP